MQELLLISTGDMDILKEMDLEEINPVLRSSLKYLTLDMTKHRTSPTDPVPTKEDINNIFPNMDLQIKYYYPKSKSVSILLEASFKA